jgi:hypothetical protein
MPKDFSITFQIIRVYEAVIEADSEPEAHEWVNRRSVEELEAQAIHKDTLVDYVEVEALGDYQGEGVND